MRLTSLLIVLLLAACATQPPRVSSTTPVGAQSETGVIDGARYRIDIPDDWNGELVMALRGYTVAGRAREGDMPRSPLIEALLARGYAVAASDYRTDGWAVAEALEDNERLRRHFAERHGAPARHWVMGFSMGGLLTLATVERHPGTYAGALSLCGANAPAGEMFNEVLFTLLVAVEHFFPQALGTSAMGLADLSAPERVAGDRIEAALGSDEPLAAMLATRLQVPHEQLAQVASFYYLILRELQQRTGGHPLDNRDVVYAGFGDDLSFNREVRRYAADPEAAAYLRHHVNLSGDAPVPVLLFSNYADAVVPLHISNRYLALAREQGRSEQVVGRWSTAPGHCRMPGAEVVNALDELVRWVDTGVRPASGEQR
jgi:pimeloyl-ACP methyl ester carboxylesterase